MIMMMYAQINLGGKCKFREPMTRMACIICMTRMTRMTCIDHIGPFVLHGLAGLLLIE